MDILTARTRALDRVAAARLELREAIAAALECSDPQAARALLEAALEIDAHGWSRVNSQTRPAGTSCVKDSGAAAVTA